MVLCSSVEPIFLGSGTEEYIIVILLGTEEYKSTEECILFFCSERLRPLPSYVKTDVELDASIEVEKWMASFKKTPTPKKSVEDLEAEGKTINAP
jgi:hypothetical protein